MIKYLLMMIIVSLSFTQKVNLKTILQNSAPKYFMTKDKKLSGICIDIIDEINNNSDLLTIQYANNLTTIRTIRSALASSKIDIFVGFGKNDLREKRINYIDIALYKVNHSLLMLKNSPYKIKEKKDLILISQKNKVLALNGTNLASTLKAEKKINLDLKSNYIKDAITRLLNSEGSGVYHNNLVLSNIIRDEKYKDKFKLVIFDESYSHYIAYSKNVSEESLKELERILLKLKNSGRLIEIYNKYILK